MRWKTEARVRDIAREVARSIMNQHEQDLSAHIHATSSPDSVFGLSFLSFMPGGKPITWMGNLKALHQHEEDKEAGRCTRCHQRLPKEDK
jgi:hypothetical protein